MGVGCLGSAERDGIEKKNSGSSEDTTAKGRAKIIKIIVKEHTEDGGIYYMWADYLCTASTSDKKKRKT